MSVLKAGVDNIAVIPQKNVFQTIMIFLNRYREESADTARSYERNIRNFFQITKNKNIENLRDEDLKISLSTLTEYQTLLKKSGKYKNSSITQMIESVRSLYNFLKGDEYDVNVEVFKLLKKLSDDRTNVGFMSSDETQKIADLTIYEKHKGMEKRAIILLALQTSIRKKAILKLRYGYMHPDPTNPEYYIIESDELFDKGAMVKEKLIHKSLYDLLVSLNPNRTEDDLVFSLKYDQLNPMIKRLARQAGFSEDRNLSFHSIKRAGVHLVFEVDGLHAAQMQAGHKSVDTTTRYINRETNMAATILSDTTNEKIFEELTKDEMIILLKSFGNGIGLQLRQKANEIIKNRGAEKQIVRN